MRQDPGLDPATNWLSLALEISGLRNTVALAARTARQILLYDVHTCAISCRNSPGACFFDTLSVSYLCAF